MSTKKEFLLLVNAEQVALIRNGLERLATSSAIYPPDRDEAEALCELLTTRGKDSLKAAGDINDLRPL